MISLTPLIKLLMEKPDDFGLKWFRKVGGAAEFAQIRPEALPLPAAWLVRAADKVRDAGERAEDVGLGFDVVIAIDNVRTDTAGEIDDILLKYRRAVYKRLRGWEVEPNVKPLSFAGGQVLEYTAGDLYWRDRYQFSALITNYLPDPPDYSGLNLIGEQP